MVLFSLYLSLCWELKNNKLRKYHIRIANFILTQQNDYHEEAVRRIPFISHHLNSLSQLQIHSF